MKKTLIFLSALSIAGLFALASCATTKAQTQEGDAMDKKIAQIFPAERTGDPKYNTGESHLSVLKYSRQQYDYQLSL